MSLRRFARSLLLIAPALLLASVAAAGLPDYAPDANHTRDQVPDAYKWDLGQLFASEQAWTKRSGKSGTGSPPCAPRFPA